MRGGVTRRQLVAPLIRVAYDGRGALRPNALVRAAMVFRWGALLWLAVLVVSGIPAFASPVVGWLVLGCTAAWTIGLSVTRPGWSTRLLTLDLVVASALLVVDVRTGLFATIYPLAAPLTWAAVHRFRRGVGAGLVLAGVLVGTHVATGLLTRPAADILYVASDAFTIVLAAAGVGLVSTLLDRSAHEVRAAQAEELLAREATARLAERESLARELHDSVLQALTMVHKRGRELAARADVTGAEVAALADLAAGQEAALRDLVLRPAAAARAGTTVSSLRARLDASARHVAEDLDVQVAMVGDVSLPAAAVDQVGAAVDQALANVVRHAGTRRAWVFADAGPGEVTVSVRDDGRGFVFDEATLRAGGRYGLLGSIRGRIEDLGGRVRVDSAPGRGTELEFSLPLPAQASS